MSNPENDNLELITAVERFLSQEKEKEEMAELECSAHLVMDLLNDDSWETIRNEVNGLALLWTSSHDFMSKVVPREESVKCYPRLIEQNQNVLDLIDKIGYAKEGIYQIVQSNKSLTHIPRSAMAGPISSPLPIDKIKLDQFTPEGLRYMPDIAHALGIKETDGLFTRLSITGITGGLTDKQTRAAMEKIFSIYPKAGQILFTDISTEYYIFGNNVGKTVNRPTPLLVGRAFDDSFWKTATSEFSSGDEFLVQVALNTLTDKLLSLR
ncbi:MAG: hypothetical protein V1858_03320 [Candidatus Gottesmanbacteria bacterium]